MHLSAPVLGRRGFATPSHARRYPNPNPNPKPNPNRTPNVLLNNQATAEAGRQCVHGAAMTGVHAAQDCMTAPWEECITLIHPKSQYDALNSLSETSMGRIESTANTFSRSPNTFEAFMLDDDVGGDAEGSA